MLDDLGLATVLKGRRQRHERLDPLLHLRGDRFEQPGNLRPRLDLLPLAVTLGSQVDNLGLQLQHTLVGRVVIGDVLVLAASPLGRRPLAARPLHVLVDPARGNVGHE